MYNAADGSLCDCESVIKITMEGDILSRDVDLFSVFSFWDHVAHKDKFVTFGNAWNSNGEFGSGIRTNNPTIIPTTIPTTIVPTLNPSDNPTI